MPGELARARGGGKDLSGDTVQRSGHCQKHCALSISFRFSNGKEMRSHSVLVTLIDKIVRLTITHLKEKKLLTKNLHNSNPKCVTQTNHLIVFYAAVAVLSACNGVQQIGTPTPTPTPQGNATSTNTNPAGGDGSSSGGNASTDTTTSVGAGKAGFGGNVCAAETADKFTISGGTSVTIGSGTAASCTEAEVSSKLTQGGNVTFNCGSSPVTIRLNTQILITKNISIDGKSLVTLDGGSANSLLKFDNKPQIVIKNINFSNAKSNEFGAAIQTGWQAKSLTVINSTFTNNSSTKDDAYYGGGAIHIHETPATIINSTFINNKGANGGAISMLLSNLTIKNSTFNTNESFRNYAPAGGGGAVAWDGTNEATGGQVVICGSLFKNNKSQFQGGALFSYLYSNHFADEKTTIEKSQFEGNVVQGSGFGGGLWHANGNLLVKDSTFQGNQAAAQGGAVWLGQNGKFEFENTTITDNLAQGPSGKDGLGGGIMLTSGTAELRNVTVARNTAGFQAGGIMGDNRISVKNSIIAYNIAKNNGNDWNIKHNCMNEMTNLGKNIQFPAKNPNDGSDKDCVSGIVTADPLLAAAIADNGGPTTSLAIKTGSPAIGAGAGCVATDQRGTVRKSNCDIGAFELK